MASASSVLRTRIISACRATSVATQAGVSAGVWSSSTTPRVFSGIGGLLGGRNRGRLPFVEVEVQGGPFTLLAQEGGTMMSTAVIRVHVGGSDPGAAEDLTYAILSACLQSARSQAVDNLMVIGNDSIESLEQSPWGHQRDARIDVEHTYSRDSYEVT